MPRITIPARLADLEFSIEAPAGFAEPPLPETQTDFNDPTVSAPLTLLASPVAAVFIAVSARPAYADGSLMDWFAYLAQHHQITTTALMPGKVGGPAARHPAILAEGRQVQDGMALRLLMAMLEDGGRLVTVLAMCPEELWPSYETPLRAAVDSFELARPRGGTAPLIPDGPVAAEAPHGE